MELFGFFKGLFRKKSSSGFKDRTLRCSECNKNFVFEAGEQEFFKSKGFQEPKRCPRCRKKHRPGSRFRLLLNCLLRRP